MGNSNSPTKLAIVLLVAFFISLLAGAVSFQAVKNVIKRKDQVVFDYSKRVIEAEKLARAVEEKVAQSRAYIITREGSVLTLIEGSDLRFQQSLTTLREMVQSDEGNDFINRIERQEKAHQAVLERIFRDRKAGRPFGEIVQEFEGKLGPQRGILKRSINDFIHFESRQLAKFQESSIHEAKWSENLVLGTSILSVLLLFAISYVLLSSLRRLGVSERRFLDLVNHLDHSLVWEADADPLIFNFVSERSQFLIGVSPKEFQRDPDLFFNYVHPDDRESVRNMLAKAAESKTDQRIDHRMISVDGEEIWVQTGVHVRLEDGQVDQYYGMTVDITPIKRAQETAKNSEESLRRTSKQLSLVMDAQPNLIAYIDRNYVYRVANRAYQSWFGLSKDEVIGRYLPDVIGKEAFAIFKPKIDEAFLGRTTTLDAEAPYKHGRRVVSCNYVPDIQPDGFIPGVFIAVTDITAQKDFEEALKEREQRFRMIVEAMPQMAFVADADGNVTYYSKKWRDFTGNASGNEWENLVHPDHIQLVSVRWKEAVATGKPYEVECLIRRKDGQFCWVLGRANPVFDDNGQIVHWIGTNTDIDSQKRAQVELSRVVENLNFERDLREKLVNMLTHDLRTPLSACKMSVQMMSRKASNSDMVLALSGKVLENVNRMDKMVQDILDTSRIRGGKQLTIKIAPCNMKELVQSTLDDLSLIHGDRFILKEKSSIENPWEGVWDSDGLRRVLENLANNAVKYGNPSAPITVLLERRGHLIKLSVHNKGDPMAKVDQEKLFDPFARASSAEKSGKLGWGIGLTLVRGIAEAHGGNVKVKSDKSGTTFIVTLPIDATRSLKNTRQWEHPTPQ